MSDTFDHEGDAWASFEDDVYFGAGPDGEPDCGQPMRVRQPQRKSCKHCGATGLRWINTDRGFRLYSDAEQELHVCEQFRASKAAAAPAEPPEPPRPITPPRGPHPFAAKTATAKILQPQETTMPQISVDTQDVLAKGHAVEFSRTLLGATQAWVRFKGSYGPVYFHATPDLKRLYSQDVGFFPEARVLLARTGVPFSEQS